MENEEIRRRPRSSDDLKHPTVSIGSHYEQADIDRHDPHRVVNSVANCVLTHAMTQC